MAQFLTRLFATKPLVFRHNANKHRRQTLAVEHLESRQLLGVLTVTTAQDNGQNDVDDATPHSLRWALAQAQLDGLKKIRDTIRFEIGPGDEMIRPRFSELPQILFPVTIDATPTAKFPFQDIILNGDDATLKNENANGLVFSNKASSSTVFGLTIRNFELHFPRTF